VQLLRESKDAALQAMVAELRLRFQERLTDSDERKTYVYLLAKFVKSFHFLSSFFGYEQHVRDFAVFCEYVGPQLIKAGSVSELMKQVRATIVERAAVIDQGVVKMPPGTIKPKPRKGGGGGGSPPKKVSVQEMIKQIREQFSISDDEALYIKEVSQEKMEDQSILQTVAAHCNDRSFLDNVFRGQVNSQIQDAYVIRELYEPLGDPKYIDAGAIFDIMAHTVVQHGLVQAGAA